MEHTPAHTLISGLHTNTHAPHKHFVHTLVVHTHTLTRVAHALPRYLTHTHICAIGTRGNWLFPTHWHTPRTSASIPQQVGVNTLHFTLYTSHSTLDALHFTHYTSRVRLCTLHFTLYTLHFTHYTLYCTHHSPPFIRTPRFANKSNGWCWCNTHAPPPHGGRDQV